MAGVKKEPKPTQQQQQTPTTSNMNHLEDNKYVQLPPETISTLSEAVGGCRLGPNVARALSEDVTYRTRELAEMATQFMRKSCRKKMTQDDVARAMKWMDAAPLLGYGVAAAPSEEDSAVVNATPLNLDPTFSAAYSSHERFVHIPEAEVFVPEDEDVSLTDLTDSRDNFKSRYDNRMEEDIKPGNEVEPIFRPPTVTAYWLCIEGVPVDNSLEHHVYSELPQQQQTGQLPQRYLNYFSVVTMTFLSDDATEVGLCLADLRSNGYISPVLPALVSFIRNGIQKYAANKQVIRRFLRILDAIFANRSLNLSPKPFLSHLVTAILSSLISDKAAQQQQQQQQSHHHQLNRSRSMLNSNSHNSNHHQHNHSNSSSGGIGKEDQSMEQVAAEAAGLLRIVLARWATPVNLLQSQTLRALREYLRDPKLSPASQYGALTAMIRLGPRALQECLLPQLQPYLKRLELFGDPSAAHMLKSSLLLGARCLLTYYAKFKNVSANHCNAYAMLYEAFGDSLAPASEFASRRKTLPTSTSNNSMMLSSEKIRWRVLKRGARPRLQLGAKRARKSTTEEGQQKTGLDSSYLGAASDLVDLPTNFFDESLEGSGSSEANVATNRGGDLQAPTPKKISRSVHLYFEDSSPTHAFTLPSTTAARPRITFVFPSGRHRPFEGLRRHQAQNKVPYYMQAVSDDGKKGVTPAAEKQSVIVGTQRKRQRTLAWLPDYVEIAMNEMI